MTTTNAAVYCLRCAHDARCDARCGWTRVGHAKGCPRNGTDDSGTGGEMPYYARVERRNDRRTRP